MKILMLVEASYPQDIRVKQEAQRLAENGHKVSVIGIKDKNESYFESINRVNVYRIPKIEIFKRGKQIQSHHLKSFARIGLLMKAVFGYGFEFLYFTVASFLVSFLVLFKHGFDVIHTHNPPDTLFSIALFYKMFGKKFVYDHHDLSPDLFMEKYNMKGRVFYNALLTLEKLSCGTADFIIATNESYKEIEIERNGINPKNIYVVRNGPELAEMKRVDPIMSIRSRAGTILAYLGAINVQDGVDNLLEVLSKVVYDFKYNDICLLIIGSGDYLFRIKELTADYNLEEYVIFTGWVKEREYLCRYLSTADIFVDAAPYSILNDSSTFIKHMEYMVFRKPVVSFALKESMYSLRDAGLFVKPNDTYKMAKAIIELIGNKKRREAMGSNAGKRVKQLSWDIVSQPLLELYDKIR